MNTHTHTHTHAHTHTHTCSHARTLPHEQEDQEVNHKRKTCSTQLADGCRQTHSGDSVFAVSAASSLSPSKVVVQLGKHAAIANSRPEGSAGSGRQVPAAASQASAEERHRPPSLPPRTYRRPAAEAEAAPARRSAMAGSASQTPLMGSSPSAAESRKRPSKPPLT